MSNKGFTRFRVKNDHCQKQELGGIEEKQLLKSHSTRLNETEVKTEIRKILDRECLKSRILYHNKRGGTFLLQWTPSGDFTIKLFTTVNNVVS